MQKSWTVGAVDLAGAACRQVVMVAVRVQMLMSRRMPCRWQSLAAAVDWSLSWKAVGILRSHHIPEGWSVVEPAKRCYSLVRSRWELAAELDVGVWKRLVSRH